jgi:hypothetical protein
MDLLEPVDEINLRGSLDFFCFPQPELDEDSSSHSLNLSSEMKVEDSLNLSAEMKVEDSSAEVKAESDDSFSRELVVEEDDDDFIIEEEETRSRSSKRKKPTASRKRKVIDDSCDSVTLSREALLNTSSEDFDDLVSAIQARRSLTEAEKKEVRRQKRLIKNRESAATSRNRKKQALENLAEENKKLKDELEYQNSRWAAVEAMLQRTGQLKSFLSEFGAPIGHNKKTAGMGMMFIVLLSFGLFMNLPFFAVSSGSHNALPTQSQANLRRLMSHESDIANDFNNNVENVSCYSEYDDPIVIAHNIPNHTSAAASYVQVQS